jgi:RNA:NAD 2'-phosphotransferase (TPT1/KptA family)
MKPELIKISKFLSLILRHKPESIGVWLTEHVAPQYLQEEQ